MRDLEKAALEYATNKGVCHTKRDEPAWHYSAIDFKAGAAWQAEQDRAEIERLKGGLAYIASKKHMIGKPKWDAEFVDVAEKTLRGEK